MFAKRCFSEHRFPNGFPNENTPEIKQIPGAFNMFEKRSFSERQSRADPINYKANSL